MRIGCGTSRVGLEELRVDPVLTCCQHGDGTSGRNLVNSPEPIDQKHLSIGHKKDFDPLLAASHYQLLHLENCRWCAGRNHAIEPERGPSGKARMKGPSRQQTKLTGHAWNKYELARCFLCLGHQSWYDRQSPRFAGFKKGALLLSGLFNMFAPRVYDSGEWCESDAGWWLPGLQFSSFPQLLGLNADEPGHGAPAIAGPCLSKAPAGRKVWYCLPSQFFSRHSKQLPKRWSHTNIKYIYIYIKIYQIWHCHFMNL